MSDENGPTNRVADLEKAQAGAKDPGRISLTAEQVARWVSTFRGAQAARVLEQNLSGLVRLVILEQGRYEAEMAMLRAEIGAADGANWMLDEKTRTCVRVG